MWLITAERTRVRNRFVALGQRVGLLAPKFRYTESRLWQVVPSAPPSVPLGSPHRVRR